jgi:hypothetical protein
MESSVLGGAMKAIKPTIVTMKIVQSSNEMENSEIGSLVILRCIIGSDFFIESIQRLYSTTLANPHNPRIQPHVSSVKILSNSVIVDNKRPQTTADDKVALRQQSSLL